MDSEELNRTTKVNRSPRGTIEFVIREEGVRLTPQYRGGNLVALVLNNELRLMQGKDDGPWSIVADCDNKEPMPIKSVTLDKNGHLTIKTRKH